MFLCGVLISLLLAHNLGTNALPSLQVRDASGQPDPVSNIKCPRHDPKGAGTSDTNALGVPADPTVSHYGDTTITFSHFDNPFITLDNARELEVEALEELLSHSLIYDASIDTKFDLPHTFTNEVPSMGHSTLTVKQSPESEVQPTWEDVSHLMTDFDSFLTAWNQCGWVPAFEVSYREEQGGKMLAIDAEWKNDQPATF